MDYFNLEQNINVSMLPLFWHDQTHIHVYPCWPWDDPSSPSAFILSFHFSLTSSTCLPYCSFFRVISFSLFVYIFLSFLPIPSLHMSLFPLSVISLFGIRHTSVFAEAGPGHGPRPGVTGEQGIEGQRWRDGWRNGGKRKSGKREPQSLSGSVLSLAYLGSDWVESGASVLPAASVWGLHLERTDITHILTLYVTHTHTNTQSVDSTCSYPEFIPSFQSILHMFHLCYWHNSTLHFYLKKCGKTL